MERRDVLRSAFVAGSALAPGCLFGAGGRMGSNSTLTLINRRNESITVSLVIEKRSEEVVYDDSVRVDADSTRELDVLGDRQYYIDVSYGDKTADVPTRPICGGAYTKIIITEQGEITSDVKDCE